MKVEITCPQDPVLEKHCQKAFTKKFEKFLVTKRWHPYDARNAMLWALAKEAYHQEWYDFAYDGDGQRCVIYEAGTQTPKLLVPEVRIVDA